MTSRHLLARGLAEGPGGALRLLAAIVVLALTGCGGATSTYTLMQANLCLSGLAGCYDPAVVEETAARIRGVRPDAVTLNEVCRNDVARIARRTGYHARFSRVIYLGVPLRCVHPGGRGRFGDAVLTKAPIERAESRDFDSQAGIERRRWLCVTAEIDVCTAHLNTRASDEVSGNEAQCAELASLLARRAAVRPVIFGGDVNRRDSCAPDGFWTRTDRSAHQAPGLQHVYGSDALRSPSAEVTRVTHSDHDALLVRAQRTRRLQTSSARHARYSRPGRSGQRRAIRYVMPSPRRRTTMYGSS